MEDNDTKTFLFSVGKRIQNIREFRGMSRKEFGEALGLQGNSASTGVYALETYGGATRLDTVYRAARILNVTPGFLLDGGDLRTEHIKAF